VDQALVQHAEDEVDDEQRREYEDRRALKRCSKCLALPWKLVCSESGGFSSFQPLNAAYRLAVAVPGARLNEIVTDGNWPV